MIHITNIIASMKREFVVEKNIKIKTNIINVTTRSVRKSFGAEAN